MRALSPTTMNPYATFHSSFLALQSTIDAMLAALTRPPRLINQINHAKKTVDKNFSSISRSTRWPLGLLDDTRQRLNEEREERARAGQAEVDNLSRELRYTQQTVAMELAGWQDMHERMGRKAIRELARGMVVVEKMRLEGMRRALRKLQDVQADGAGVGVMRPGAADDVIEDDGARSTTSPPIALAGLETSNQIGDDHAAVPQPPPTTTSGSASGASPVRAPMPEGLLDGTPEDEPSGQNGGDPTAAQGRSPRRNDLFGEDVGGGAGAQPT